MADGNVVGIKSIKEQIQLIGTVLFSSRESREVQNITSCLAAAAPPAFPWISPWPKGEKQHTLQGGSNQKLL